MYQPDTTEAWLPTIEILILEKSLGARYNNNKKSLFNRFDSEKFPQTQPKNSSFIPRKGAIEISDRISKSNHAF